MAHTKCDTLILGAGVAGLAAALRCREANVKATILEARDTAGGILDSFSVEGYTFDNAVHLSFATEQEVRRVFDSTPYYRHTPQAFAWETDRWLKYPVQNNLHGVSLEDRIDLLVSFVDRPHVSAPENYYEWLVGQYGVDFVERYSRPYTQKYWCREPENLSTTWVGPRVREAATREILQGAFVDSQEHYYYTEEMRYPVRGGYRAFIEGLIGDSDIRHKKRVVGISLRERTVTCQDGDTFAFCSLVSSLPLPLLVPLISEAPDELKRVAEELKWTQVDLVSVGLPEGAVNKLWFYIYDEEVLAARAYSPSVKAPDNAPSDRSSLQFEIYHDSRSRKCGLEESAQNSLAALEHLGICNRAEAELLDRRTLPFANVIFDIGMEERRQQIRDFLGKYDVQSVGRYGEWDYLWSNQSFMSGYQINL